jgi:hypothetical protein
LPDPERSSVPETCPNCGSRAIGRYCSDCGQKRPEPHDLGLAHSLDEALHELSHLDGRLWTTVRLLFFRPGQLALDYFEGRRARHVRPLRLFLFFSAPVFMLLFRSTLSLQFVASHDRAGLLERWIDRGAQLHIIAPALYLAERNAFFQLLVKLGMVTVGLLAAALVCYALFKKSQPLIGAHAVFILLNESAILFVGSFLAWIGTTTGVLGVFAIVSQAFALVFTYWAARRAYGGTAGWTALRVIVLRIADLAVRVVITGAALFLTLTWGVSGQPH